MTHQSPRVLQFIKAQMFAQMVLLESPERLVQQVATERMLLLGPVEFMRQNERDAGHTIIKPGDVPWLPKADWPDNVVIAQAGRTVRLIAVVAKRPGTGAYTRMIRGICAAGLTPCGVWPSAEMRKTHIRWGWVCRERDEWFPPDGWKPR